MDSKLTGVRRGGRARGGRALVALALLILSSLLIAACGGGDSSSSSGGGGDTGGGGEDVTLRMPSWWWGEPGNKEWLAKAVGEFESTHPGVTVERENVPFDDYGDKVLAQVSAGDPPDVIHLTSLTFGDFVRVKALADLAPRIESESDISDKTFVPAQFEAPISQEGSTYGVIHSVETYLPFYNEEILNEAGYTEFPEDPDAFLELVKKTSNPPQQFGYAAAVKPGSPTETFTDAAIWMIAAGGALAENEEPTIDKAENVEGLTQLKELFDADTMPTGSDKSTYRQQWWDGKVGVLFDGTWMKGFAESENPQLAPEMQTALLPWPGHRAASIYQIWAVPDGSEHQQEAFELIDFLQSEEMQQSMVSETKNQSPRLNAATPEFLKENPWFAPFAESAEKYAEPMMPAGLDAHAGEVTDIVAEQVERVLYQGADPQEALESAQDAVESVVAEG